MCKDTKLTKGRLMMVNLVCRLDWVMGCSDIWLNLIPDCVCEDVSA